MKTYNTKYKDYETLKIYLNNNNISKYNNILVQVFSGIAKKDFIEEIIKNLIILIPKCKIIGATSAREILNGEILSNNCILSISVFEKTKIKTMLYKEKISDFSRGVYIADKLIALDTKAIISFVGINTDGQAFLQGINSKNNNIVVAGGIGSKNDFMDNVYVFTEDGVERDAVVAAALDSKELYVNNESSFNWIPIGKEHQITQAEGNEISSIDNIPAEDFYSKYIGTDNNIKISRIGAQFPLMIKRRNTYIGRSVMRFTENKGIIVIPKINIGDKIRIGYGDLAEILKGSREVYEKIKEHPSESLFIYSCDSRRKFLKEMADKEIAPINNNFSVSGFYTYGEFNHIDNENMFFIETMTILVLSEDMNARIKINAQPTGKCEYYSDEDSALYSLIKTTGEELNELNLKLEEKVKEKTEELEMQYYKDQLTGLENRNKLIMDLTDRKYNKIALIDIKSFNDINDFYGNVVGDSILISLSNLINSFCNMHKLNVYRVNSDIFAVVDNIDSKQEFIKKIGNLQKIINQQSFFYNEVKIFITVTIGVSLEEYPIFEKSEMALNFAKKNRTLFEIYKDELNIYEGIKENLIWTEKIKDAIVEDRIIPFFQPIVNNVLGTTEKFEALIRMIDRDGKIISPYFFLEIAKKSGLYKDLTRIMLEKTFEILNKTDYEISINLVLQDIISYETRKLIIEKLENAINPQKVVFEIVESEGIENFNEVTDFIRDIKKHGAKIAIDDFGTGYSNFSYLMKLNVDYIKIDGSIIKNIHKDKSAELVTKTLVAFAKELGIETIAEFVAEEEIYNKIKDLKIDYSQGYYFSEPKESIE